MPALTMRLHFLALISIALIVTPIAGIFEPAVALDPLPRSPRVGSLRIPLLSYNRVPISKFLSDPASYHLREIKIAGTVRIIKTTVMTQGCGVPYELTIISLEDESGQVEVLDKGACGRNRSAVRGRLGEIGDRTRWLHLFSFIARSTSRLASRVLSDSLRSCCFLPLANPISTLARPRLEK
jgi:hypothetical protein